MNPDTSSDTRTPVAAANGTDVSPPSTNGGPPSANGPPSGPGQHEDSPRTGRTDAQPGGDAKDLARQARRAYRQALEAGTPLTEEELGQTFGRSRSWGALRKGEVLAARDDRLTAAADPAEPPGSHGVAPADPTQEHTPPRAVPEGGGGTGATVNQVSRPGASVVVWTALLLGIGVSIAANIMSTQLVTSQVAAWIGSAFWPLALLLSLEIVTRVAWPTHGLYVAARLGGVGLVATVAAIQSYRHMAALLLSWGEDHLSAYLGPLAVDGLMLTAATALLAQHRHHRPNDGDARQQTSGDP